MRNLMLLFFSLFALTFAGAQPSVQFVITSFTCSEGIGTYQFAVSIVNADANATSVDINVVGGNAVYGTNFTYGPVTVTFPASSPFDQLFTVNVIDDSTIDGDKTVTFGLANATNNATIGANGQTTLTMTDVDTPKISMSAGGALVAENAGSVNVSIALNRGVRDTTKVRVKLVPTGTTAVNGVDFTFGDTTLVWPPDSAGILNAVIPVINNAFYERDRTVELTLDSPTNGAILVTDSTFVLTIRANSSDTIPGCSDLFFGQYVEGTGNNRAIQVYNPTSVPIDLSVYSVLISFAGGSSMAQYNLSGTIAPLGVYILANPGANAGITSLANATWSFLSFDGTDAVALLHLTDTIDVIGQLHTNPGGSGWAVTGGSTVQHTLIRNYYDHAGDSSWTNAASSWNAFPVDMIDSLGFHHTQACGLNGPVATVRFITQSDTMPQVPSFDYVVIEVNNPTSSNIRFTVAMDPNLTTAVDGYGHDILYTNNDFNSPPGITRDTFWIEIFARPEVTPIKTVTLRFINVPNNMTVLSDSIYTLYIFNNSKFTVSFLGAGYSYPKGSGLIEIPLVTTTYSSQPTTVDVSLSTGNAITGVDFLFNDTTVTFPAFSIDTQGVWVTILDNNIYQSNKQANFNLSNVTNQAAYGISAFTLTIINNDSLAGGIFNSNSVRDIAIYPNPVHGSLVVRSDIDLTGVVIMDMLGNEIGNIGDLQAGTNSINVSSLSSGVYFLKTIRGEGLYKRFVKIE